MEKTIKDYLETQCKKDTALAEKYDATKIKDCVDYIMTQAKDYLERKNGYIADEIVFKWARDFFLEGVTVKSKVVKEEKKKPVEQPVVSVQPVDNVLEKQLSLF